MKKKTLAFLHWLWVCVILDDHQWTSKMKEGILPSDEEVKNTQSFREYSKIYCKCCGVPAMIQPNIPF